MAFNKDELMEYELKGNIFIQIKVNNINFMVEGFTKETLFYRTIGLKNIIGYEIEFNISMHPAEAVRLMKDIVPKLLNGFIISDNMVTNLLTGAPVLLKIVESKFKYYDEEKVLRIVFSDETFKLPNDNGCNENYSKQLE